MRPDGSQVTRLTNVDTGSDPQDNYHPSWSPDGAHLAWTHVTYQLAEQGGTQWVINVADFIQDQTGPHLANVTAVLAASNARYETQVWAPDGSGVLFTQAGGKDLAGFKTELYEMDLCRPRVSGTLIVSGDTASSKRPPRSPTHRARSATSSGRAARAC